MSLVDDDDLPPAPPGIDPARRQTTRAFVAEALAGVTLATRLRLICVPVLMAFIAFFMRGDAALWFVEACLVGYAVLGVVELLVIRRMAESAWRIPGLIHLMIVAEMALIAFAMFGSQALFTHPWPAHAFVDSRPVVYFFFVISLYAFTFSPWLMVWASLMAATAWSAGMTWILMLPGTVTGPKPGPISEDSLAFYYDPRFVDIGAWIQDVVVILLTGFVLAAVVWRSRLLVRRQIAVARERANLARHFAPTMIDEIAGHDRLLETVTTQEVAVMFVDVVGFTRQAESYGPDSTIALLRGLHRRLEKAVFDNGGTLDKFLGDGVMATFGTPRPSGRDAANALAAAHDALAAVAKWNAKRAARGAAPTRLAIGLHQGPVVLGDVGSERRLEYAVIGDTVNVAARLEQLCRDLDASIVCSDAFVATAREQGGTVDDLTPAGEHELRGRQAPVLLWRRPV